MKEGSLSKKEIGFVFTLNWKRVGIKYGSAESAFLQWPLLSGLSSSDVSLSKSKKVSIEANSPNPTTSGAHTPFGKAMPKDMTNINR